MHSAKYGDNQFLQGVMGHISSGLGKVKNYFRGGNKWKTGSHIIPIEGGTTQLDDGDEFMDLGEEIK